MAAWRARAGRCLLGACFFVIAFGLGYPTLNRYEAARTPGLSGTGFYQGIALVDYADVPAPFRFRVVTPSLAGALIPLLSRLSLGSWNPLALAFLLVNAMFVALSALLLVEVAGKLGWSGPEALVSAFLYATCF